MLALFPAMLLVIIAFVYPDWTVFLSEVSYMIMIRVLSELAASVI
jgi:hypothetical protein